MSSIEIEKFINPVTKRKINIGGKVHKQLVKDNVEGVPELPVAEKAVTAKKEPKVKATPKDTVVTKKGTYKKQPKPEVEVDEDLLEANMKSLATQIAKSHASEFEGLSPIECKELIMDIIMNEVESNPSGSIAKQITVISEDCGTDDESDSGDEGDYTDEEEDDKE